MTNSEAKQFLENYINSGTIAFHHLNSELYEEAIELAIKAFERADSSVSASAYEQVKWERDVAIDQLKELGYGLGQKIKSDYNAVSREDVLELVRNSSLDLKYEDDNETFQNEVKRLPTIVVLREIEIENTNFCKFSREG